MISADFDLKKLAADIARVSNDFGEMNQTGIARWGVSACRRLTIETQVWGDGEKAKEKQKLAMLADANRVVAIASNAKEAKLFNSGVNGKRKVLKTPAEVNAWIESRRKGSKKRTFKILGKNKAITTRRTFDSAMGQRFKRIWKGKGGWIGAGQGIAKFQKAGSRLNIGKNFAGAAHKWKAGGRASMRKSTWDPAGTIENLYEHVATSYVLSKGALDKAIKDGGENTVKWYEKAMQGRLNKRK